MTHTHSMNIMHKMYMVGRLVSYVVPVLNATSKQATIKSCYIHVSCDQELNTQSINVCHCNIMRTSTAN